MKRFKLVFIHHTSFRVHHFDEVIAMAFEIRAAVLTVSDRSARGEREDVSGALLAELLSEAGAFVVARELVSDEFGPLVEKLRELAGRADVNLVLTTGGTG